MVESMNEELWTELSMEELESGLLIEPLCVIECDCYGITFICDLDCVFEGPNDPNNNNNN
jgi:hypothetical protein